MTGHGQICKGVFLKRIFGKVGDIPSFAPNSSDITGFEMDDNVRRLPQPRKVDSCARYQLIFDGSYFFRPSSVCRISFLKFLHNLFAHALFNNYFYVAKIAFIILNYVLLYKRKKLLTYYKRIYQLKKRIVG